MARSRVASPPMDFHDTPQEAAFRGEVASWLAGHLVGEFKEIGHTGGPADDSGWDVRLAWEKELGAGGWIGLGWPTEHGGRGATLLEQVIFEEEYAKSGAPARVGFFGEQLFGPTLVANGTDAQKKRFLPKIQSVEELWCQGYSEPDAGSDLANVATKAVLDGDEWVITGQKVWTTLAHRAHWCFAVVRTDPTQSRNKGLSYLLIPMDQPGITIRPLRQITGTAEFNEVFFDEARTASENVLGEPGDGWRVAMATLGFERGTAFVAQQLGFMRELQSVVDAAKANGAFDDPIIKDRLAHAYAGVQIMKFNGMRMFTNVVRKGVLGPEASIGKLFWSNWHRNLGELTMDILGPAGQILSDAPYELDDFQRLYLSSRGETIYAGSSEIQRNIVAERVLGLPREPKGSS